MLPIHLYTSHGCSFILLVKGGVDYLDDLIIWAPDFASFTQRLTKTFTLIKENDGKINLSKCEMAKNEVTFLGYRISKDGCQPDPKNVEAVLEMRPPTKSKEIGRFLGRLGSTENIFLTMQRLPHL